MSKKKNRNKKNTKATVSKKKIKEIPQEEMDETYSIEEAQETSLPDFWFNKNLHMLLIFLVSIVIYSNTFSHEYAVDDSIVILRNEYTKKGMKGMKGIWTEDTFTGFFGKKKNLVAGGRYRPLSLATFALELELWGTPITNPDGSPRLDKDGDINYKGNPNISHIINVLMYAILCVVIYLFLLQLFAPRGERSKGYFIALAGALLYALHPIHTEAVANIKGRDEIMVLLGSVLATYWAVKAAVDKTSKSNLYLLGAALAFVFAIFSKENAVTFLAIIPAALYFFTETKPEKIATYTSPFIAIFLVFWFGIRGPILGDAGSITSADNAPAIELMNDPFLKIENNRYVPYEPSERLATVMYTWFEYVRLLVVPHPLTNDYYPKHIRTDKDIIPSFGMPKVLLSILLHLLLGLLLLQGTLKRKPYAFFILFYLATFSVVSNLIFPIGSNMAERFMFLPSVGFSALCAMGLWELYQKQSSKQLAMTALVGVSVLYAGKTFTRNFAWKNDYILFTTDIVNSPYSAKLNNAVSGVLQDSSNRVRDTYQRKIQLEQSLKHSQMATSLHPTYNNAWLLQGNANTMLGSLNEKLGGKATAPAAQQQYFKNSLNYFASGIKCYEEVKRLRPDHPDVVQNLGVLYRDRGKLLGRRFQRMDESIASLTKSLEYRPKDFETFRLLGIAYGTKGVALERQNRLQEAGQLHLKAIEYLKKALEITPNSAPLLYNLEIAHMILGKENEAAQYRAKRIEVDPSYDPAKQDG